MAGGEPSVSSSDRGGGNNPGTSTLSQYSGSWYYSSANYSDGDYEQGVDWTVVGPVTGAYALIFLLGLTGNAMVIFAVHRCRRLHTATSLLLANLALADLLLVLLLLPMQPVIQALDNWPLGEAMCRILPFINIVSPTCSIYTMTAIALERCYAVLFPLETKAAITMGRTRVAILVIWLFSLLMCVPAIFSKKTKEFDRDGMQWTTCNDTWTNYSVALGYMIYVCLLLFGVPILILAVCYTLIILRLCTGKRLTRHMRPLSAANLPVHQMPSEGEGATSSTSRGATGNCIPTSDEGGSDGSQAGKQRYAGYTAVATGRPQRKQRTEAQKLQRIVAMLIVVVVVFLMCWGPYFTFGILHRVGLSGVSAYSDQLWKISLALHLLAYANSCVNPFIYAFMSESFREGFMLAVRGCSVGKKGQGRRRISQQSTYWSAVNTRNMSLSSAHSPNRIATTV